MEDVAASAAFFLSLSLLLLMVSTAIKPFLPASEVYAPTAPSAEAPRRLVYVYSLHGDVVAVAVPPDTTPDELLGLGASGGLLTVFELYPGGYRCSPPVEVRIGGDPYRGLWCPPPWHGVVASRCPPQGPVSIGRWLAVSYRC